MHDDPTRTMGQPGDPDGHRRGNVRLLVAGLIAVIVGLVVAIVVIASDDGGDSASTASEPEITLSPSTAETTTAPSTTESTAETTTAPTTTETTSSTTTTAPTTPGEEENGSGGLPAP